MIPNIDNETVHSVDGEISSTHHIAIHGVANQEGRLRVDIDDAILFLTGGQFEITCRLVHERIYGDGASDLGLWVPGQARQSSIYKAISRLRAEVDKQSHRKIAREIIVPAPGLSAQYYVNVPPEQIKIRRSFLLLPKRSLPQTLYDGLVALVQ